MVEQDRFECIVDGRRRTGPEASVINPATGEAFATYSVADSGTLDDAVAAAQRAHKAWRGVPLGSRRRALTRMADQLRDHADELARLLTSEQGKPLAESFGEVQASESVLRSYAQARPDQDHELFRRVDDTYIQSFGPLGVVAGIVPWNFPLLIAAMKIGPALLVGNAIIVKPSPTTPATTLALGAIVADDLPRGLVQVLGDDGSVGPKITAHPGIAKISFTGSTVTGRRVMAASGSTLKRLTLELGGNDPAVVLDDADVAEVAERLYAAAFSNAGQVCGAAKRIYVQSGAYQGLRDALVALVRGAVVGNGMAEGTTIGPLQNRTQFGKAAALLDSATKAGRITVQSSIPDDPGFFISPTLVEGLCNDHPLVAEEQFAPLLPLLRFEDEDEAVRLANSTPYGLTASVWSTDQLRAERVAERIDAGLVCINRHNENPVGVGISMTKQSGIGWLLGDEGIKEYSQAKLIIR